MSAPGGSSTSPPPPPPDRASLVAHRGAWDRLPDRTREVLGRIRFSPAAVNAMDRAVNLDGLEPLEAARQWASRHPETVAGWLGP